VLQGPRSTTGTYVRPERGMRGGGLQEARHCFVQRAQDPADQDWRWKTARRDGWTLVRDLWRLSLIIRLLSGATWSYLWAQVLRNKDPEQIVKNAFTDVFFSGIAQSTRTELPARLSTALALSSRIGERRARSATFSSTTSSRSSKEETCLRRKMDDCSLVDCLTSSTLFFSLIGCSIFCSVYSRIKFTIS
jgi:hypothetical protein